MKGSGESRLVVRDRLVGLRNLVQDEAATNFLHRDPLSLVGNHPVLLAGNVVVAQANSRTTPQLFCAHGRDINVEKSTFDGRRLCGCNRRRRLFACLWRTSEIDCVGHTKED
jgi:hypothetical protein